MFVEQAHFGPREGVPGQCICGSQKGPFVDMQREIPVHGRVYLCRICVARVARVAGLAKGKRMDELMAASEVLEAKQHELAEQQKLTLRALDKASEYERQRDEQKKRAEEAEGKLEQMQHLLAGLREQAATTAALAEV